MSSSAITGPVFSDARRAPAGTAAAPSFAFNDSTGTGVYLVSPGVLGLSTAGVQRVVVDASGNVGIGTASPLDRLHMNHISNAALRATTTTNSTLAAFGADNSGGYLGSFSAHPLVFYAGGGTERMRIDASGNFFVGQGAAVDNTTTGFRVQTPGVVTSTFVVTNTAGACNNWHIYNQNATNNGYRFYVGINGGISNFSGNNTNLSDERTKTDIKPAGNYLEKICAIPVRTFRYKDQGDDLEPTLGVIAQEVEKIAPELVNVTDGFGDTPEDGIPLKTIYTTDMQFALMKALQELKEKNDALEARLAALEAK